MTGMHELRQGKRCRLLMLKMIQLHQKLKVVEIKKFGCLCQRRRTTCVCIHSLRPAERPRRNSLQNGVNRSGYSSLASMHVIQTDWMQKHVDTRSIRFFGTQSPYTTSCA